MPERIKVVPVYHDAIRSIATGFLAKDPGFGERILATGALELLEQNAAQAGALRDIKRILDEGTEDAVPSRLYKKPLNNTLNRILVRVNQALEVGQ